MSDIEIIQQVWKICQEILGPEYQLFLFGSRAQKNNNTYSDFDFLIKGKAAVPENNWQRFTDTVQEMQTLYKIDLVDFGRASEDLKKVAAKSLKEIVNGQIRSKG